MLFSCFFTQAPIDFLQPQQETTVQTKEFTLHYRTLEIRFQIDKMQFGNIKQLSMRCVATIERFPSLTREKGVRLFIVSTDYLTNQKLTNAKNSATGNLLFVFYLYLLGICHYM